MPDDKDDTAANTSTTPRYNHGHTTIFDASAPTSIASTSTYQRGSSLTIVPFNQASKQDVEALLDYIYGWHGSRLHLTFRWYLSQRN